MIRFEKNPIRFLASLDIKYDKDKSALSQYFACLNPILYFYGWSGNEIILKEIVPENLSDYGLHDLLETLSKVGLSVNEGQVNLTSVDERTFPCLLVDRETNDVFVVLERKERSFLVYSGVNEDVEEYYDFDKKFDAYFIKERLEESTLHEANFASWCYQIFQRFQKLFIRVFVLSFFINVFTLLTPLFVMSVYDRVVGSQDLKTLGSLGIGMFLVICVEALMRFQRSRLLAWIAIRIDSLLTKEVFRSILYLSPQMLGSTSALSNENRIRYSSSIRDFLTNTVGTTLLELPFVFMFIAVIGYVAGSLVYIPIAILFVFVLFCGFVYGKDIVRGNNGKSVSEKQDVLVETLSYLRHLKSTGLASIWKNRFFEKSGEASYYKFENSFKVSVLEAVSYCLTIISGLATLVMGINLVWTETLTIGSLIATMMLIWRVIYPLQIISSSFGQITELKSTLQRIHRVLTTSLEQEPSYSEQDDLIISGNIDFNNVGVKFQTRKEAIISGLSLSIRKGELISISGGSGSGKTTILNLINNMITPQMGTVTIDNVNISQYNPILLRRKIAFIGNNLSLLNTSIYENVALTSKGVTKGQVVDALIQSGAWAYVSQLNGDVNFNILNYGSDLPEKVRFQILVARSLLKKTKILLIDQIPSSVLNGVAFDEFYKLLSDLKGVSTTFIVTNREDIVNLSDKLIVPLGKGQVVAGEPKQLVSMLLTNGINVV